MQALIQNKLREFAVEVFSKTHRSATGETSVCSEQLRIGNNNVGRNNRNAIEMREEKQPPLDVGMQLISDWKGSALGTRMTITESVQEATHKSSAGANACRHE